MSSENDPLLPQNEPAPEILGSGNKRVKGSEEILYSEHIHEEANDHDSRSIQSENSVSRYALNKLGPLITIVVFFILAVLFLTPGITDREPQPLKPQPAKTIADRVYDILDGTPLIDGHNDLAIFLRYAYGNKLHTKKFLDKFEKGGLELNVDLPRLKSGQVGGAFWSAFVQCPDNASNDFSDGEYATAVSETLQQIDVIRRLQTDFSTSFTAAGTPLAAALDNFHSSKSLISPISIEGLHQVPQTAAMSTLRLYYSLGVRAATLTWNCHNAFADAAMISSNRSSHVAPYHRGGLTSLGRQVITEMNRLGMLVDISHTSYWTQKAVLSNNTSAAPVIFSHSSAFSLCQHPRNVHDDVLDLVKETGSLVMINFTPGFISCLPPPDQLTLPQFYEGNNTIHQVVRHVMYVGERIGYDHVGLGSDFDGMGAENPIGLDGVDKFPALIGELLKSGVSDQDAAKVAGGNLLRVWKQADAVAKDMQSNGVQEGEDEVAGLPFGMMTEYFGMDRI